MAPTTRNELPRRRRPRPRGARRPSSRRRRFLNTPATSGSRWWCSSSRRLAGSASSASRTRPTARHDAARSRCGRAISSDCGRRSSARPFSRRHSGCSPQPTQPQGGPALRGCARAERGRRVDERGEQQPAVGRAEQGVDGMLRVRHEPEHVPGLFVHPRRPRARRSRPLRSEGRAARAQRGGRTSPRPRTRHRRRASPGRRAPGRHCSVGGTCCPCSRHARSRRGRRTPAAYLAGGSPAAGAPRRGSGSRCRYRAPDLRQLQSADGFHHGSEARDRPGAQVVAVREAARKDDGRGVVRKRPLAVPDELGLRPDGAERPGGVTVVVRAGEDDD